MEGERLNDDSLNSLNMYSHLVALMLEFRQRLDFHFQIAPLLKEAFDLS